MEPEEIKYIHERSLLIGNVVIGKEKGDLRKIKPPLSQMEWKVITDYVMSNQEKNAINSDNTIYKSQELRKVQELKLFLDKAMRIEELRILRKLKK